jgi:hypothetical protein
MGVATKAAGWSRQWKRGFPAPNTMGPAGEFTVQGPGDPIGLKVELFLNEQWVDISGDVYYRDRVKIARGRPDEASQLQPSQCTLTINNRDGKYSPRNPLSPYYGKLGRNTPLRVSRVQNGIQRFRFYGEVSEWPVRWDISGTDVYTQITASGQLRRINQGTPVFGSPMFRAFTVPSVADPGRANVPTNIVAYWPAEDGKNSTSIASGILSGTPMTTKNLFGDTQFASSTTFISSSSLPSVHGSVWVGNVPSSSITWTANSVRFLLEIPEAGEADAQRICTMYTTGTVQRVELIYGQTTGGSIKAIGYDRSNNILFNTAFATLVVLDGIPLRVSIELFQTTGATDVRYTVRVENVLTLQQTSLSATAVASGAALGAVTQVAFNQDGGLLSTVVGHVTVQSQLTDMGDVDNALIGYSGEVSSTSLDARRIERICAEEDINFWLVDGYTWPVSDSLSVLESVSPGPQPVSSFLNIMQEVVDACLIPIYEPRDGLGFTARLRRSLYNQSSRLTLNYASNQLSSSLDPVDDDQHIRNDVIVNRTNGSSARQLLSSGSLSTADPPNGVGRYSTSYGLNLSSDGSQLLDAAGWRLHLGTVDEARYPQISINLRHPTFTSSVDMMNAALTLDIGDRLVITNPPAWLPPDQISQLVLGYNEVLGIFEHDISFNCVPESPYQVGIISDTVYGHADTDGATLSTSVDGSATTLSVARTTATSPLWTTSAGDFPFDIRVGGERMTVTNISGAASPQTFTVTRSVNGIVKAQTSGTSVQLWQPMTLSL